MKDLHVSSDDCVGIAGAGTMGAGIAQVASQAGHIVVLYDSRPGVAARAIAGVQETFSKLADKGKIAPATATEASARLKVAEGTRAFAPASIVIEAIAEDLEAKRQLFRQIETVVSEDCLLTTNTSSLSVTAIGSALHRPERLVGMHFFNPAPMMELVEVVRGLDTNADCLSAVTALAIAWKKSPVQATSTPGFIVNRVARPFYGEALRLLQERAANAATLDAIFRDCGGFRMGPFELMDLIGLDINLAVTTSVFDAFAGDRRFAPSPVQRELVAAGFLGRKTGRGYFAYGEGNSVPRPDFEAATPAPHRLRLVAGDALVEAISGRLPNAERVTGAEPGIEAGSAFICLSDGRTAAERTRQARALGGPARHDSRHVNLVLADWALDYSKSPRIAISRGPGCSDGAYRDAVGALQAAGFVVSLLRDLPGMVVLRTMAMLANEASDAVNQGVATAHDVDLAMLKGVNYPCGPLAWADIVGIAALESILSRLHEYYGEERYRVSPLIRRLGWIGNHFHGPA